MLIQADAVYLPYADQTFHTVVTSPPYWGLRKYTGEQGEEPLGLEATPERHIERMVEVFREVRRVLRDDGCVWLNYGDCFASGGRSGEGEVRTTSNKLHASPTDPSLNCQRRAPVPEGMKQGSLMLMPHRLAIALQDDGWIIRNDVVWYKRNPMPESVAGWRFENGNLRKSSWRHTRAHEYVFQLVKKMGYFCNQEAVREAHQSGDGKGGFSNKSTSKWAANVGADGKPLTSQVNANPSPSGRNPRSVMDVPTAPYKGAHYATFPPKLIAPLIRASCPRRACPECGQAWAAVVEQNIVWRERPNQYGKYREIAGQPDQRKAGVDSRVLDYRPTCECGHKDYKPGKVLDIFGGSGTTGMVAKELMRDWVVMDVSRPYLDGQAKVRTRTGTPSNALDDLPMFTKEP